MNPETVRRLLENSGYIVFDVDAEHIVIEDPACILRSFSTFIEYAWIVITVLLGLMLAGWAISMIRGAKNDIFTNLRNLILIFGILSAVVPIVNFVYGDDLFARGCAQISVPTSRVAEMLDARDAHLSDAACDLCEDFDIQDTGPTTTTPALESAD